MIRDFQLPMDWENPTEERVILGIIKLPAKQKDRNLPPVFINPGVSSLPRTRNFTKEALS